VASGYLSIKNVGDSPDRLVSATAEIAGHTGIHQMSMSDGMMQMRELTEGLAKFPLKAR
jgi:periplasmic copper chaperone A